jgi:hypothetical protein
MLGKAWLVIILLLDIIVQWAKRKNALDGITGAEFLVMLHISQHSRAMGDVRRRYCRTTSLPTISNVWIDHVGLSAINMFRLYDSMMVLPHPCFYKTLSDSKLKDYIIEK